MDETSHAGGCQCGAIRYRARGPLEGVYACHCDACKKQSASAFSLSVTMPFARLAVQGEPMSFTVAGQSGAAKECAFCPACGTRLWHRSARAADMISLKAGTLDDCTALVPRFHLWTSRKCGWVVLDPDIPAHDTQPEDMARWRQQL